MGGDKQIVLRIQSSDGMKRLEVSPITNTKQLYEKIREAFSYTSFAYQLYKDRKATLAINSSCSKLVKDTGLKHGDIVYLRPVEGAVLRPSNVVNESELSSTDTEMSDAVSISASRSSSTGSMSSASVKKAPTVVEDEVDLKLQGKDGLIRRPRDPKSCRHEENAACPFCFPLDPWNEGYLKEQNIKHLSFHSYLRKITSDVSKGKFAALEDLNVSIKDGCRSHPPWPRGICSKCQPSAVTLNRQIYRHVDNVMFENPEIVEKFLSYWRSTGYQRVGFLYGQYEEHADVPLGIRARVAAIYEPPQESTKDRVKLLPHDDKAAAVDEVALQLGLRRVGWIFTDLLPEDISTGTVKHLRGIQTYFLSAQECITAAHLQNLHPNPCKVAQKGSFGSKFATVLVTGDEKNQVHMVGYQVSNQCMALVRERCLVPTKDAPEFGYIIESTDKQYVPDVFFKQKDEYGNEVTRLGRPLPVEYLLVDVPVSTPKEPVSTFTLKPGVTPFPIENRFVDGQIQDFTALATYLGQFTHRDAFLRIASDFHFLLYLYTMDIVPLRDVMGPLLTAIRERDGDGAEEWSKMDSWVTVEKLIEASTISPPGSSRTNLGASGSGSSTTRAPMISPQSTWTCAHCTFINSGTAPNCEVCNLPHMS